MMKMIDSSSQAIESHDTTPLRDMVRDVLTTVKIGIVDSNLFTTFSGLMLAMHFTGASWLDVWPQILFVLIGTALVIGGGCSLNNYIDRDIDPLMERTHERPSATGKMTGKTVLVMGVALSVLGLVALLAASITAAAFGLLGLLVYVLVYTLWLKRSHSMNTVVGSVAGAVPPIIGWAAVDPSLNSPIPWIMFLILFLWQPPHFLALAMKRVEEYRRAGIPMLPVVAGFEVTKRQMIVYVAALVPTSFLLYELGPIYIIGALVLSFTWLGLAIYGFKAKDTIKWAKLMFVYSLNYMMLLFLLMIVAALL
ncbi:protoheme IX farnesyltransferase [Sporolactobacillus terrae]|uniref:Protoheme IX farnesyltransferase n=2 Tax=Sporolactobacillus terrae TaxID=269673 RepID=A0ABX5Q6G6_9BACL|nr:heme o synthase [Sporolactobacillus terrae]QAA22239.1 protoheme IX farnesyltransferase [Sporolactobacillus terrae]QAA25213.1 protoheme IX farnesyltransferase [Sporolactobacillus terrae]